MKIKKKDKILRQWGMIKSFSFSRVLGEGSIAYECAASYINPERLVCRL